jgi:nucleoside-diphosphate-sugar epimerase
MSGLRGKRVLVTGASGFLGTALMGRLRAEKAEVFAVSRQRQADDNVNWIRMDLGEDEACARVLADVRPHYVFHLAGFADGARDMKLVLSTFERNALLTVRLLTAAAEIGCERFVYAASMEEPDPHDASSLPNSPYSASKWVGTVYTRMFHRLYQFPSVALRIFLTYGPGPQARTKLIPYSIISLLDGRSPELSSGARLIDVIYIDDVVDAFLAAVRRDKAVGRIVDVGSGRRVSIRDIITRLCNLAGGGIEPSFGAMDDRPDEMMPTADIERSAEILGWKPRISLDEGLSRTIEWYRQELKKA